MKVRKFEVICDIPNSITHIPSSVIKGTTVYDFMMCDYGLAGDDTRVFGHSFRSVTLDPTGGYPSFTIPEKFLSEVK